MRGAVPAARRPVTSFEDWTSPLTLRRPRLMLPTHSRLAGPLLLVVTGLTYLALAQYVLWLNDPVQVGAGFWPAAGLTVAILLLTPYSLWPWILVGIALGESLGDLAHGYPLAATAWWTAGNMIEPLLGALLVRRFSSYRGELVPLGNLLAFIGLAVIVAPLIGATVGSVGTVTSVGLTWAEVWPKYFVGDALGVLVVAPLFLTWREPAVRRRLMELVVAGGGLALTSLAMLRDSPGSLELVSPYFTIPFLTWAALRFGMRGSAWFVFILAQIANAETALGRGPFVGLAESDPEAVTMLQIFLLIAASSTFVLATLASELSDRGEVRGLLRAMADSMPQLVWVANDDGAVTYYNRRGDAYLVPAARDRALEWTDAIHPEDRDGTEARWQEATRVGRVFESEHRIRMADGSYRWHLSRAEHVDALDGAQWYGTSTDIHELKLADEAKDEFIAIAAHELRNPVAALHGTAQQLDRAHERGTLTEERLSRYARALVLSTAYLARLTRDLTDVSRLQRGALPLHLEPTDVARLIEAVASGREWPAGRIHTRIEGNIGTVELDPTRVRQVLSNLLDNALKYSHDEEPVDIAVRRDGDGVLIVVTDRGIGLPADSLEQIFTPFGRAPNVGETSGLGMGLYVARELAERHNGTLRASSDGAGHGTSMQLWLPLRPNAVASES